MIVDNIELLELFCMREFDKNIIKSGNIAGLMRKYPEIVGAMNIAYSTLRGLKKRLFKMDEDQSLERKSAYSMSLIMSLSFIVIASIIDDEDCCTAVADIILPSGGNTGYFMSIAGKLTDSDSCARIIDSPADLIKFLKGFMCMLEAANSSESNKHVCECIDILDRLCDVAVYGDR